MAFSQQFSAVVYDGNNSTSTAYPVTFPVLSAADIWVSIKADGEETVTVLDRSAFSVIESSGSYSVKTATAYPNTTEVTIFRSVEFTQPFEFPEGGAFPTREVERSFDRVVMLIQQLWRGVAGQAGGTIVLPGNGTGVYDCKVWADATARASAAAAFAGQLGVQLSDSTAWIAGSTTAGDWSTVVPAPLAPGLSSRVAIVADHGESTVEQGILFDIIEARNPDHVLMAGDCNYVGSYPTALANVSPALLAKTYAAEGNHDLDADGGTAFRAFFSNRPASPAGLPGCFKVTICDGLVDLFVLSSGRKTDWTQTVTGGVAVGSPMHQWFVGVAATSTAPRRWVMFHHPEFTPCPGTQECEPDLAWPWPDYGVSVVINGHSHLSYVARRNGVLYLNPSAISRLDGSMWEALQGATAGAWLEWAETEKAAIGFIHVREDGEEFEFVDRDNRVSYAGSNRPNHRPYLTEADIWGETEALPTTEETRYFTHSAGAFELEALRLSVMSGAQAECQVTIGGVNVFAAPVIVSGSRRFAGAELSEYWRTHWVKQGARIEVKALALSGYGSAWGLRAALTGRRITA